MAGNTKNKVTIADVARLAEVSASSVSNVLNGRTARMTPETRDRILQAIRKLGYTPNLAARQLKTGHSRLIGLIVPSVANPFYGNFARYVEEAALELGYQVMLGNSRRDADREKKYAEKLMAAGAEGIILGTSLHDFSHLRELIDRGLAILAFDRPLLDNGDAVIDSVCIDNRQVMRLAVKHLSALGHERIGFVSGPVTTVSRTARLEGYRLSLEEAGLTYRDELVWEGGSGRFGDVAPLQLGRQGAHFLLSRPDPPTALCTVNDMFAFGIYGGARDLGLKVPDDLSVLGVDNLSLTEVVEPPLTTVEQPMADMARASVERLLKRMESGISIEAEHQLFYPKLIVRGSTARCTKRSL